MLVDTDTGMILALRVTDDTVGDSKMFVPLLEDVAGEDVAGEDAAASVLADGAYASRDIHRECARRGIRPLIRLRTDSAARGMGRGDAWGLAVRDQLGGSAERPVWALDDGQKGEDQKIWKRRVGYGRRWVVERSSSLRSRGCLASRSWPQSGRTWCMRSC